MKSENIIIAIGALIALVLDVVISPNIPMFSATPNFMIAYTIVVSTICKTNAAYVLGFCMGIICDLLGYGPVGLLGFLMVVEALVARKVVSNYGSGSVASGVMVIFALTVGVELLHALAMLLLTSGIDPVQALAYIALPSSVFDCILGVAIYPFMIRLLVPTRTKLGSEPPIIRLR